MSVRESIPAPLRLSLSGATAIHDAIAGTRRYAEDAGIEPSDVTRLAIIVEELVTNLYEHGGLGAEDVFTLEMSCAGPEIDLVLVDPGRPFDPRTAPPAGTVPPRGGGAGLKLVRAWASEVDYRTSEGLNRLTMRIVGNE